MRRPWDAGGLGCQVRMLGPEPGGTACSTPSVPLLDGQPSLEHARAAFGAQIVKVQRADALRPVGEDASSFPAVTRIVSAWPARHHNCPQLSHERSQRSSLSSALASFRLGTLRPSVNRP